MESNEMTKRIKKNQDKIKGDPIRVFCRVRPLPNPTDQACLQIMSPHHILISLPSNNRTNGLGRDVCYTFNEIFDEISDQKAVFDSVALPCIENVLNGNNSLLFTYGVSGSGKTHTMTGTPQDGGILPRSLDVIFNSVSPRLSKRCIFLPDKLNGYDIQSEEDAKADRDKEIMNKISKTYKTKNKQENIGDLASRLRDNQCISIPDETNCFGVFITYVEIYNNTVFDLLDDIYEETSKRPLQSKIVREDSNHRMFVHGVNEMEVNSSDEAYEIYCKGLKRKKVAETCLNSESSRSHSVFTIKIVQAPMNNGKIINDKSRIIVSQLSLVDLAGSERTNRTHNTGQRLREAGNINNSLLSLRMCIEMMRDNQKGCNKVVPFRDCRLTHLFKHYFEGNGQVTMVLCVTPHINDLEEMLHVLKFAEITRDVQVNLPKKVGIKRKYRDPVFSVNQDREEILNKHIEVNVEIHAVGDRNDRREESIPFTTHWHCDIPETRFIDQNSENVLPSVVKYLEEHMAQFQNITTSLKENCIEGKEKLIGLMREATCNIQDLNNFKNLYKGEVEKVAILDKKALSTDTEIIQMKKKLEDYSTNVQRLQKEISSKAQELSKTKLEKEKAKEDFKQKMVQEQDRLNREFERKLRSQNSAFKYEIKTKEKKIKAVKRILHREEPDNAIKRNFTSDEESVQMQVRPSSSTVRPLNAVSSEQNSQYQPSEEMLVKSEPRSQKVGAVNRRYRRSKSAENEVWLDHRPKNQVPSGTLMQPTMAKRKSVTKLTDAKDVTHATSKYCLLTQNQDSNGDLETRLYKGDVIPTSGGGAQVLFNDIEVLYQVSPSDSPNRRTSLIRKKFEEYCEVDKISKL